MNMNSQVNDLPAWTAQAAAWLDVRPILASGGEPLSAILETAATVGEGEVLVLDAPFNPVPLRLLLGGKGFEAHTTALAPDHWRLYFRRGAASR
jgi:uncharacterized protein (DUF2249 family)